MKMKLKESKKEESPAVLTLQIVRVVLFFSTQQNTGLLIKKVSLSIHCFSR